MDGSFNWRKDGWRGYCGLPADKRADLLTMIGPLLFIGGMKPAAQAGKA